MATGITSPAIRTIRPADDPAVARIIRTVMPEFGACGAGFAINDAEVDCMYATYAAPGCRYFVIEDAGEVCGGGGIAPLAAAPAELGQVCELRKMYFLPTLRGRGLGRSLLATCLDVARQLGYQRCYLETLTGMDAAQRLYREFGFKALPGPLGNTGHFSCDRYFLLEL